jgi:hypothetical protein
MAIAENNNSLPAEKSPVCLSPAVYSFYLWRYAARETKRAARTPRDAPDARDAPDGTPSAAGG